MYIKFSPQRTEDTLTLSRIKDVLTVNGRPFDFSQLKEGDTLPSSAIDSKHFIGPVERINGELHLNIRLPHGANPSKEVAFPATIRVTKDGQIAVPKSIDGGTK